MEEEASWVSLPFCCVPTILFSASESVLESPWLREDRVKRARRRLRRPETAEKENEIRGEGSSRSLSQSWRRHKREIDDEDTERR